MFSKSFFVDPGFLYKPALLFALSPDIMTVKDLSLINANDRPSLTGLSKKSAAIILRHPLLPHSSAKGDG